MKKIIKRILLAVFIILLPVFYVIYTFAFTGPMADDEFQKELPSIVKNLQTKIEGSGEETLVFIHGYPDSLEMWDAQAEYFKKDYTVARFTLPGFELEDTGERPSYSMKQIRMITDGFIKSLNKDKVTVIAHDWGAVYASQYLKQSDLVDRLVLLDIGSFGDEKRPTINAKYMFGLAVAWTLPEFLGEKATLFTADKILDITNTVDRNKTLDDLRVDPRMTYPYWNIFNSIFSKTIGKSTQIDEYGTPFLFIYGKDKTVWFHAESWAKELQDKNKGQVESVPGGHWFMQSSPDLTNQKIDTWLKAN